MMEWPVWRRTARRSLRHGLLEIGRFKIGNHRLAVALDSGWPMLQSQSASFDQNKKAVPAETPTRPVRMQLFVVAGEHSHFEGDDETAPRREVDLVQRR